MSEWLSGDLSSRNAAVGQLDRRAAPSGFWPESGRSSGNRTKSGQRLIGGRVPVAVHPFFVQARPRCVRSAANRYCRPGTSW